MLHHCDFDQYPGLGFLISNQQGGGNSRRMGRKLGWNQGPLTEMSSRGELCVPQDEGKGEGRGHVAKTLKWKGKKLGDFRLSWHQSFQ